MSTIGVVNDYLVRICTISIYDDLDFCAGDEFYVVIDSNEIPFKVISIGNICALKKINFINNDAKKFDAKVVNVASFKDYNKLVG